MVLWRNRHNCSLNEKDALRRLKVQCIYFSTCVNFSSNILMQMKNSPIGYALPSPLLGLPVSDIPVAPWESYTVCSADNCEGNAAVSNATWWENPGHSFNLVDWQIRWSQHFQSCTSVSDWWNFGSFVKIRQST